MRVKRFLGATAIVGIGWCAAGVAAPATASQGCENEARRTGRSAGLPDCRAYEMVSPVDKNGGDIQALPPAAGGILPASFRQSAEGGSKLTYTSISAFGDATAGPWANQYIATRGPGGWLTHGISAPRHTALFEGHTLPPTAWETETFFDAFTPDLCNAWVRGSNTVPLVGNGLQGYANLYRRTNCGAESYQALSTGGPFGPATAYLNDGGEISSEPAPGPGLRFQGASTDMRHQVFLSSAALLPDPVGLQAQCSTPTSAATISYQWLRNGVPIEGATSPAYTIGPPDEGTAIQCQVFAANASSGSTQVANAARVVVPALGILPPLAPTSIPAPSSSATLTVGGPGGQTLTCDPLADEWKRLPIFSYRWYRNGVVIAGATASTYDVTTEDLASRAVFQCAVTATNSGGAVVVVSTHRATSPAPSPAAPGGNVTTVSNPGSVVARMDKKTHLYDFNEGGLERVGILPGSPEVPNPENSVAGTLGSDRFNRESLVDHAVSEDGAHIFWSSKSGTSARGAGQIYVRVNGSETLHVSKAAEALSGTSQSLFWTAAADGTAALFTTAAFTSEMLSSNASLFEFDVESETTRFIAGEVPGVLGAADDLSRIYFVSREALDEGAQAGQWNLYVEEEGVPALIGVLSDADRLVHEAGLSPFWPVPVRRASRVTADGRHIAFQSLTPLTGYDNADSTGKRYTEVFHYSADTGDLICVSCNLSGPPSGPPIPFPYHAYEEELKDDPAFRKKFGQAAALPTWEREQHASRALSEDGNRVFFHSHEALALGDTNGVKDVYQWEAQGVGSCTRVEGCVDLISTGTSPQASEFVDASANGDDVFIATTSSIDPRDAGAVDIYDARVGGGFSFSQPPPRCLGDACRSVPSVPDDRTPAGATFQGPGTPFPQRNCNALRRRALRLAREARQGDARELDKRAARKARKRFRRCQRAVHGGRA